MEKKNEINSMIRKYQIVMVDEDSINVRNAKTKLEVQMLKAAKPRILAELIRRKDAQVQKDMDAKIHLKGILANEIPIHVVWVEGSSLSAWAPASDVDERVLKDLGVARDIGGWGVSVDSEFMKEIGEKTSFFVSEVEAFLAPEKETEREKELVEEARVRRMFFRAKQTGKPQLLRTHTEPCNDPMEECDLDVVREFAMPEGHVKTTRHHTW